jgi:hypothetical protein
MSFWGRSPPSWIRRCIISEQKNVVILIKQTLIVNFILPFILSFPEKLLLLQNNWYKKRILQTKVIPNTQIAAALN